MKAGSVILFVISGLFTGAFANPVPAESAQLTKRTTNLDAIFAAVEARTEAARKFNHKRTSNFFQY
jgi:hypothetical protein